ncbi:hypothetical protein ACHAP0_006714 [Verticillium nonalfalfae]
MGRDDVILPRAVEALIAEGQTIVVFEEYVLRLDSWLERHPGGRLAILHMVGRDATDEIKVSLDTPALVVEVKLKCKDPGGSDAPEAPEVRSKTHGNCSGMM